MTLTWNAVEGGTYSVDASSNNSTWTSKATGLTVSNANTKSNTHATLGSTGTEYARVNRTALATYDSTGTVAATVSQSNTTSFNLGSTNAAPTLTAINTLSGATEDTPFTVTYAALFAASNAADTNGDALSFRVETVSSGTLTKNGEGVAPGTTLLSTGESLVWTPSANANGTLAAFTVKAYDGALASTSPVPVNISVVAVNDAPTLTTISNLTPGNEDSIYPITYAAVAAAANEADVDGDALSFRVEETFSGMLTKNGVNVTAGTLLSSGDTFLWTPSGDANGPLTAMTVTAYDGIVGSSAPVAAQALIMAANDAPTLTTVNTLTGATEDTPFTISHATLAAAADENDADGGPPLDFLIVSVTSGTLTKSGVAITPGTTRINVAESLVWTPAADANGTLAAFTVKAHDGVVASSTAVQVNVSVADVIDVATWDGSAGTGDWGTAANWLGDSVPLNTDNVSFIGAAPYAITLGADRSVAALNIQSDFPNAYTFTGNSLTLASGGSITTTAGTGGNLPHYINSNLVLNTSATINAAFYAPLVINGGISGSASLTKAGAGHLSLNGTCTYTGGTIINASTLHVGLGDTTGSIIGDVSLVANGAIVFDRSDETTFAGVISGTGRVEKGGTGTLTLSGTGHAVTGSLSVFKGALSLSPNTTSSFTDAWIDNGTTLTVGSSVSLTLGSLVFGDEDPDPATVVIGSNAQVSITTLTLGNSDASSSDVLTLGSGASLTTTNAYLTETLGCTGTVNINGGTWTNAHDLFQSSVEDATISFLNINSGGSVTAEGIVASGTWTTTLDNGSINLTSTSQRSAENDWVISAGGGSITNVADLYLNGTVSGSGALSKSGAGKLTISGTHTRTGNTTVNAGTLSLSTASLADAADVSLATGSILDLGFTGNDTVRTIFINGVKQATGTWGSLTSTAAHKTAQITGTGLLNVTGANTAPTMTSISPISGATEDTPFTITYAALAAAANEADADGDAISFLVTFTGSGALTKNGAAVVAGSTTLAAGEGFVWTPSANTFDAQTAFFAKAYDGIVASSNGVAVTVIVAAVVDGPIWTGNEATSKWSDATNWIDLTVPLSTDTVQFNGAASYAIDLNGNRTVGGLIFGGSNAFSLSGNTITLSHAGSLVSSGTASHSIASAFTLQGEGTVNTGGTANVTLSGALSGIETLTKTGAGTLTLSGSTSSFTGDTTLSAGTLAFAPTSTNSYSGNIANSGTLSNSGSSTMTLSGVISGTGALSKSGAGTLILTGENTATGTATISGGTLQIGNGGTSGHWAGDIVNNGSLTFNRSDALSYGGVISGGGNLVKSGSGTLTLKNGGHQIADLFYVTAGEVIFDSATSSHVFGIKPNGGSVKLATGAQVASENVSMLNFGLTSALTLEAGSTLSTTNEANLAASTGTVGTVAIDGGTWTISGNLSRTSGTATININSGGSLSTEAVSANGGITTTLDNGTFTITTADDNDMPWIIASGGGTISNANAVTLSGAISGTGALSKAGVGTLNISSSLSSFTGGMAISAGTLTFANTSTSSYAGNIVNSGTLSHTGTSNMTLSGVISGSGSLSKSGSTSILKLTGENTMTGTVSITGGAVQIGNGGTTGSLVSDVVVSGEGVFQFNRSSAYTYAGNISDSGFGYIFQNGSGAVTLAGTVNASNSRLNAGGTGELILASGTTNVDVLSAGVYYYGGYGTARVTGTGTTVNVRAVELGNSVVGNLIVTDGASVVATGFIRPGYIGSSSSSLTVSGGASITSPSIYGTGSMTLDNGTVNLSGAATLSVTSTVIASGGGTINTGAYAVTASTTLSGSGALTKTGGGTLTFTGPHTRTGNTTVSAGTLSMSSASFADAADVSLASGTTLNLNFSGTDTVRSFYINGVQQNAGTWGSLTSSATNKIALITSTGILLVSSGPETFENWASQQGLGGANASATADPDNDGMDNLLEFVLGGNPTTSDAASVQPISNYAGGSLTVRFKRSDASEGLMTLTVEYSTDLLNWTSIPVGATSAVSGGTTVIITENGTANDSVSVAIQAGANTKLFARVRATQ